MKVSALSEKQKPDRQQQTEEKERKKEREKEKPERHHWKCNGTSDTTT